MQQYWKQKKNNANPCTTEFQEALLTHGWGEWQMPEEPFRNMASAETHHQNTTIMKNISQDWVESLSKIKNELKHWPKLFNPTQKFQQNDARPQIWLIDNVAIYNKCHQFNANAVFYIRQFFAKKSWIKLRPDPVILKIGLKFALKFGSNWDLIQLSWNSG